MSKSGGRRVLDTDFRSALQRMAARGRLDICSAPLDPYLEVAAAMKRFDGGKAILFDDVAGARMPVLGNFLASRENCEAAFDLDAAAIREFVQQGLGTPIKPKQVKSVPAQEIVYRDNLDIGALLPVLHHTAEDSGRFITAGLVIAQDPETEIYNASYHRLQLLGGDRVAIKMDFGRHLRAAYERAVAQGRTLPVAICLGADIALQYMAATMGSQLPEHVDELWVAGGLAGRPLPIAPALTQKLDIPAASEIVIEGEILIDDMVEEGPFGEFVGYLSSVGPCPVLKVSAVTTRANPIYHAINGFGRETVMLRKYVLEASLLKTLRAATPIVRDVEMTAGGLHRFHAIIQVEKHSPMHDGWQRNAILAAFGALKDLDQVIVVDEDIDIHDPADVEYALATRMEASSDLILIPGARGHEYVRISKNGIRAKLGIDATVPFADKPRFARCAFAPIRLNAEDFAPAKDRLSTFLKENTQT